MIPALLLNNLPTLLKIGKWVLVIAAVAMLVYSIRASGYRAAETYYQSKIDAMVAANKENEQKIAKDNAKINEKVTIKYVDRIVTIEKRIPYYETTVKEVFKTVPSCALPPDYVRLHNQAVDDANRIPYANTGSNGAAGPAEEAAVK